MTFGLPTLIAIRRRMEHLRARPLLFHEVRTPARQRARIERLERWFAPWGLIITQDYYLSDMLRRVADPTPGKRYSRHFKRHLINQEVGR